MMRPIRFVCVLLLCTLGMGIIANAQAQDTFKDAVIPFKVFKNLGDKVPIDSIVTQDHLFYEFTGKTGKVNTKDSYWVRADLSNHIHTLQQDSLWFLHTGAFYDITSFFNTENGLVEKKYGPLNTEEKYSYYTPKDGVYFKVNNLVQGKYLYFKIRLYNSNQDFGKLQLKLRSASQKKLESGYYSWTDLVKATPDYLFIGAFFFIFIFTFITYFVSKKIDFLFYSLYTLCLLLYLGRSAYNTVIFLNYDYTIFSFWFHSSLQIFINLFYVAFAKYYLETVTFYPKLDKAIRAIAVLLLLFIVVNTYFSITFQLDPERLLMNIHRLVMSVFALAAVIYLLVYAKNRLAYFIIIGSLMFTAGALMMLFTQDRHYMMAGSVIEVLLFGLGLNYKMKKANEESLLTKQEAFDNKISALRAQMNPHFVFNSLSSIQHLITLNKKQDAIKYLNKFSLLMRNLLESSIEANIILHEEISLLRKYLELEALRFNNTFQYSITIDENLDTHAMEVPALIVQPFVENAILHGLLNKPTEDKKLDLRFKKEDSFIICEIEDNGIGRQAAQEKKSVLKATKKSRGIEVTEKRLELLSHSEKSSVSIIDKTNEKGEPTGTLVTIKISIE